MKRLIIPPLLLFDKKCFSYFGCQVENCCSWRCRLVHQDPCVSPCRNKQQSRTVTDLFIRAIEEYGLPSRVRSDKGGENVGVSMYMLEHPLRGPGRGSMIVGRNVHNQRIERLWRDVYEGVLYIYYHLFTWRSVEFLTRQIQVTSIYCIMSLFQELIGTSAFGREAT